MDNLFDFLTSREIIIVYIIAAFSCLVCFIVYLVERNNDKLRRRHNTRELNKLVEKVKEEVVEEENPVMYEEPVLEVINENACSVDQMLEDTGNLKVLGDVAETHDTFVIEPKKYDESIEELEYVDAVPDQETAKQELKKLEEDLLQKEIDNNRPAIFNDIEVLDYNDNNIKLTDYEEEQEKTAIISLDELVKKEKELYALNEVNQYKDEGDEPISIHDLEVKMDKKASTIDDTFIIENVVDQEEVNKEINNVEESSMFHCSPIISPIFGIEDINNKSNDLELENTANYEKLDKEIKKTNEFLMSLKELKEKLD